MDVFSTEVALEEVLRAEAKAIHNVDLTKGVNDRALYQALNLLNSAALCLSGGGIRSAAFSLGVIQALAVHPRQASDLAAPVGCAKESLLSKFHYLSTVSGGGYIGSWLSTALLRSGFEKTWASLIGRPEGPDQEPAIIGWLRSYSNYLTPRLGIMSADTWAAIALSFRNLVLNWLIILPAACSLILLIKIFGIVSDGMTRLDQAWPALPLDIVFAAAAVSCLVKALAFASRYRPSREPAYRPNQRQFLRQSLVFSLASAVFMVQFLASDYFDNALEPYPQAAHLAVGAFFGSLIYAASWIVGSPARKGVLDFAMWAAAGAVYGALIGLGLHYWIRIPESGIGIFSSVVFDVVFGIPWVLGCQVIADMAFVALDSYQAQSDDDREWLGRASGLLVATIVGWFLLSFFVFFGAVLGPKLLSEDAQTAIKTYSAPVAGLSGIITAVLGKSSVLPVTGTAKGWWPLFVNVILSLGALIFFAALFVGLSFALDQLLLGKNLVPELFKDWSDNPNSIPDRTTALEWLAVGFGMFALLAAAASRCININRFSLHSLYRNRLIRAFLGARSGRSSDPFTDFDTGDNPRMQDLWPREKLETWRPFHIISIALNIVSSKRLAWQERKAEPFTVSPLYSGSACLGFRPTEKYGDKKGITLGTAMAISGAAASPNMGYNSSPIITFLMAMFNVRLGWWLGNPGPKGERSYSDEGPKFAIEPLLNEAFGGTTDDQEYVYLSDGGHFDNLGLYEMVRRRCRFIVVVDASCDPSFQCADLGNAVRKIAIDLGISIRFANLENLKPRANDGQEFGSNQDYHAIGEIEYNIADGGGENGVIIYVKPGFHGNESAGVRSYAMANFDFPHQKTLDQWFSESQFESYRSLSFEIMDNVLTQTPSNIDEKSKKLGSTCDSLQ